MIISIFNATVDRLLTKIRCKKISLLLGGDRNVNILKVQVHKNIYNTTSLVIYHPTTPVNYMLLGICLIKYRNQIISQSSTQLKDGIITVNTEIDY